MVQVRLPAGVGQKSLRYRLMRDENSDLQALGAMTRAGRVVAAMVGLLVAAGYLAVLVFLLSRKFVVDGDVLVVCFGVCGVAAGIGLIFVYRLLPRHNPIVLFADSGVVPIQHQPRTEIPAQAEKHSPDDIKTGRVHSGAEIAPVMKSHGSESIAIYTTHDGGGVAVPVTVLGMTLILAGRFDDGWQFLSLALLAGGAMALGLYWLRFRGQNSRIVGYTRPVSGGAIGIAVVIGLGVVMARFHFLRDFLGLAIAGGGVVAWILSRARRREESTGLSI
ncbi:MAG TPA: hypothetical protein VFQ41_15050 [Candidatus Angelobacter sp.]|nr:hypothetical protein [Candidatus Angelobacter sp.]